jgi:hypothetical protein
MPSITSIFFTAEMRLEDCSKALEPVLGCSFRLEEDEHLLRYVSCCLGIQLVLFDNHGMVNDLGIPFESYLYELDLSVDRRGNDATLADSYQLSASRYIFDIFKERLKWKSALVHDFQLLLATFPS